MRCKQEELPLHKVPAWLNATPELPIYNIKRIAILWGEASFDYFSSINCRYPCSSGSNYQGDPKTAIWLSVYAWGSHLPSLPIGWIAGKSFQQCSKPWWLMVVEGISYWVVWWWTSSFFCRWRQDIDDIGLSSYNCYQPRREGHARWQSREETSFNSASFG